jgi:heptosyltransferase-2
VWFCSGRGGERTRCGAIARLCPGAIDLSGQTTPAELAAIVKRAALCVTNDSGSMHLAVVLKRPVVSVFGTTNLVHIGPYGCLEAVYAPPCHAHRALSAICRNAHTGTRA